MVVSGVEIQMFFPEAQSLKEKRSVLQSVIKRLRNKFNVAVAEVGDQDLWQKGTIGVVTVSTTHLHCEQQLQQVLNFLERDLRLEITSLNWV